MLSQSQRARLVKYVPYVSAALAIAAVVAIVSGRSQGKRNNSKSSYSVERPPPLWNTIAHLPSDGNGEGIVRMNQNIFAKMKADVRQKGKAEISIDVFEDASLVCNFRNLKGMMHPNLEAKFPQITTMSGYCEDNLTTATLVFNDNLSASTSINIHYQNRMLLYADHFDDRTEDPYVLHFRVPKTDDQGDQWTEDVFMKDVPARARSLLRTSETLSQERRLQTSAPTARKFRLAVVTTKEFAKIHGGTRDSVMTSIVKAMARINGIFLKELGIMLELIAKNDELICLGEADCRNLSNEMGIWDQFIPFANRRGVSESDYDLGHTFSTKSGGIASVPALCQIWKHQGLSGFGTNPTPWDGVYLVAAHEFAHQLNGLHTYRDCKGPEDGQLMKDAAVEPGSGSTILSYAGTCGEKNLQARDDPWFSSKAVVMMREFIDSVSCGESYAMSTPRPTMKTSEQCIVPKGNHVQLSGTVSNKNNIGSNVFVTWDRVDPGYEDFTDVRVARFAPREPTTRSLARFLPNMYILSFPATQQMEEIEPRDGGGNQDMIFRFMGRTSFDPNAVNNLPFGAGLAATFGVTDVALEYNDGIAPLKFTAVPEVLQGGQSISVAWKGGQADATVEILVAFNTMTEVSAPDFDVVVEDLKFVSIGSFSNTGAAQVQIPTLKNPKDVPVNMMIRSGTTECYYFDLLPQLKYEESDLISPTSEPNPTPTQPPTPNPIDQPTMDPPSLPTQTPTEALAENPTRSPTSRETKVPTSIPATSSPTTRPDTPNTISPTPSPSFQTTIATRSPTTESTTAPSDTTTPPIPSPPQVPTTNPVIDATCAVEEHVCGYELVDGAAAPGYYSVCVYHDQSRKSTSYCLSRDEVRTIETTGWLPGVTNPNKQVIGCGCCEQDTADFCSPARTDCPISLYGGCFLPPGQGFGVGVEVCLTSGNNGNGNGNNSGNLGQNPTCVSPFENQQNVNNSETVGCGATCTSLHI